MKIKAIEYFKIDMPLAVPYTIAYETVSNASNIILKLTTDTGVIGWGCAAPDLEVTGETPEQVIQNIESVVIGLLKNESPFQISRINHILKEELAHSSSSIAMVDMALHDLMARKANIPLYKLLGGYKHEIATSITIGILPFEETLEQAKKFRQQGFSIIKLKGGVSLEEDVEKIIKLRALLGNDFTLRFDANQGYSIQDSIAFISLTTNARVEILEQPTCQTMEANLGEVTQSVKVPVMADESIKTLKDVYRLASNNLIDMINVKIMKVGGIHEAKHINSVSKAAGLEVMVGCLDECMLGISAGLHFALSSPNIEYADLDGNLDLLNDPFTNLYQLKNGILYPSEAAGLGEIRL